MCEPTAMYGTHSASRAIFFVQLTRTSTPSDLLAFPL
ncbi:hypothetical protein M3J09_013214 [Ascochyta lentis]